MGNPGLAGLAAGIAIFAGGGSASAAALAQEPNPAIHVLTGHIADACSQQPVQGATVTLQSYPIPIVTDATGVFDFGPMPPATYLLSVSAPGYGPVGDGSGGPIVAIVNPGTVRLDLTIALLPHPC